MGWTEFERKLLEMNGNWFLNHEDPKHWEVLARLMKEEFPAYQNEEIAKAIEHAKMALLPPISKMRIIRWLQSNLPPQESETPEPPIPPKKIL